MAHGHGELGRVDGDARVGAPRVLVQEFDARHRRRAGVIMRIPARGTVASDGVRRRPRVHGEELETGHGGQVAKRRRILAVLFQLDNGGALPEPEHVREPGAVRRDDQRRPLEEADLGRERRIRERRTFDVCRGYARRGERGRDGVRVEPAPVLAVDDERRPVRGAGVVREPRKTHRGVRRVPQPPRVRGAPHEVVGLARDHGALEAHDAFPRREPTVAADVNHQLGPPPEQRLRQAGEPEPRAPEVRRAQAAAGRGFAPVRPGRAGRVRAVGPRDAFARAAVHPREALE